MNSSPSLISLSQSLAMAMATAIHLKCWKRAIVVYVFATLQRVHRGYTYLHVNAAIEYIYVNKSARVFSLMRTSRPHIN